MDVLLKVLCLILLTSRGSLALYYEEDEGPVVSTASGRVRGVHYEIPQLNAAGQAYLGIPFALPPVGVRRFRYPQPVEPWAQKNHVLNATQLPNSCYQAPDHFFGESFWGSNMWNPNTPLSEDCLYLNVWVPTVPSMSDAPQVTRRLPVMVWIFGGGFYSGTTTLDLYDGRVLASLNEVIVVSIGYRVGALGFLCLDHPSAPCNMGLFDQLMGLDWVQRNIDNFGGDRNNITLFGESAGAASVSLHLLSPLSRDKFHRAILQSGSANMPWAVTSLGEGVNRSRELAVGYVDCEDTENLHELATCLREQEVEYLLEQQWVSRGILQFPFLPVVDGLFLLEPPTIALRHRRFKRCPILLGSNLNEGSWFLVYELPEHLTLNKTDMPREVFLSSLLQLFFHYPQYPQRLNSSQVLEAIEFQYSDWNDLNDTDANVNGLDNAIGDSNFVCPLNQFALAYADAGLDVYMYFLTQRYKSHPWPEWMGVMHGDDILFVFGYVLQDQLRFSREDQNLSRRIMKFWTNFAKTGNPNGMTDGVTTAEQMASTSGPSPPPSEAVVWPRYTSARQEYLELNERKMSSFSREPPPAPHSSFSTGKSIARGPRIPHCVFWTEYIPKLLTTTENMEEAEIKWKRQFVDWSTMYLPEWKKQYDRYQDQEQEECDAN